ncbi:MAG: WYL domain-containing protein [Bacteroidales bacterium]|nr:WYL domain-containing protein [Bacteroidales bacterium]
MPANKNALIRYKTIDACLRNRQRCYTLADLVDACSIAVFGKEDKVKERTVQGDIQMMRSDRLGYNAPIEVYNKKYYRYSEDDYSIAKSPLSQNDYKVMQEAVDMLCQLADFEQFSEMTDVVRRLQDKLAISKDARKPVIHFDSVPDLKGLHLLTPLYNHIAQRQTVRLSYQSFKARQASEFVFFPYMLKEFRNRWFVFGCKRGDPKIYNLALDRIVSVEPHDAPFRENPEFDPEHFFDDVIGVTKNLGDKPSRVTFWADDNQSKYIKTKPLHPSQRLVKENDDRSCVFEINVCINLEMYSVFMSYGPGVKVLSPPNAAAHMKKILTQATTQYTEGEAE